jgi:hypothetical protein
MRDALANPVINGHEGALGPEPRFDSSSNQLRRSEQRLQHGRREVHQSFDMLFRAYKAMPGEQRTTVQEHNTAFILVYFLRRDLTSDDFAEYTVVVGHGSSVKGGLAGRRARYARLLECGHLSIEPHRRIDNSDHQGRTGPFAQTQPEIEVCVCFQHVEHQAMTGFF